MATKRASAKITVKVSAKTELSKVEKANTKNAQKGVKQFYTDNGAKILIAMLSDISGWKMIDPELRIATKNNASARRSWCIMNKAVKIDWLTIQKIDGVKNGKATPADRPDNAIRARIHAQRSNITGAKKIGYLRVMDSHTASKNPNHPDSQKVFVYRIAK